MRSDRWNHAAALMPNGRVLVAGGHTASGGPFANLSPGCGPEWPGPGGLPTVEAEFFDETNFSWSLAGLLNSARTDFNLVTLPNGFILAAAGALDGTAELYNPAADTWTYTGGMQTARFGAATALLDDGRVLVAGGDTNQSDFLGFPECHADAEVFDPASNSWSNAGGMTKNHFHGTATAYRLANGSRRVLIAGGLDGNDSNLPVMDTVESWNPDTNTFIPAARMITARAFHSATILRDGKVLVTGGFDSVGDAEVRAEIYDPILDSWTVVSSMVFQHSSHTATPLPPALSKIMIVGGNSGALAPTATVEIFQETPLASTTIIDAPPIFGAAISSCLPGSVRAFVSSNSGTGVPTGQVSFVVDGAFLLAPMLNSGVATLPVNLPVGANAIEAQYLGDSVFLGSTSTTTTVQTVAPPVQVSGPNLAGSGTPVTLLASVPLGAVPPYDFTWTLPGGSTVAGSSLTVTPPLGSNVYSVNGTDSNVCDLAPASFTLNVIPAGVNLLIKPVSLFRDASGIFGALFTVTQLNGDTISNLQVTSSTLGVTASSSSFPVLLGNLSGGATTQFVLAYPGSAAVKGAQVRLALTLTYIDSVTGTGGNAGGSFRVTAP
jgi:hypothetical protein